MKFFAITIFCLFFHIAFSQEKSHVMHMDVRIDEKIVKNYGPFMSSTELERNEYFTKEYQQRLLPILKKLLKNKKK